jgi:hypothetical protein
MAVDSPMDQPCDETIRLFAWRIIVLYNHDGYERRLIQTERIVM